MYATERQPSCRQPSANGGSSFGTKLAVRLRAANVLRPSVLNAARCATAAALLQLSDPDLPRRRRR